MKEFTNSVTFETSCAGGAPLRMKKGILEGATFQKEDDHQYTV